MALSFPIDRERCFESTRRPPVNGLSSIFGLGENKRGPLYISSRCVYKKLPEMHWNIKIRSRYLSDEDILNSEGEEQLFRLEKAVTSAAAGNELEVVT